MALSLAMLGNSSFCSDEFIQALTSFERQTGGIAFVLWSRSTEKPNKLQLVNYFFVNSAANDNNIG